MMSSTYQSYLNPEQYSYWYQQLPEENQAQYWHPFNYQTWYNQNIYVNSGQIMKTQKPSRNQKRKEKKKRMQAELQKEKKSIGDWVKLERKDLVEGLKKIEEKQKMIKEKKREKFSHLIQIHKEVYKHAVKRNRVLVQKKRNGNFRVKKKKPSHVKKMKELYSILEKRKGEPLQQNNDGFITQNEDDEENEDDQESEEKIVQQEKIQKKKQEPKIIQYKRIGKLVNQKFNDILLREWVDHSPSTTLEDGVLKLVNRLSYKQAIKKIQKPEKAKKLIVAGLHECKRTLWTTFSQKKSKMIILALNIERNNLEGGIDDQIQEVLESAYKEKVPVLHVSTRSKLGRAFTGKFGPRITMISIVNYEGYQDMMEEVLQEWKTLKNKYNLI